MEKIKEKRVRPHIHLFIYSDIYLQIVCTTSVNSVLGMKMVIKTGHVPDTLELTD